MDRPPTIRWGRSCCLCHTYRHRCRRRRSGSFDHQEYSNIWFARGGRSRRSRRSATATPPAHLGSNCSARAVMSKGSPSIAILTAVITSTFVARAARDTDVTHAQEELSDREMIGASTQFSEPEARSARSPGATRTDAGAGDCGPAPGCRGWWTSSSLRVPPRRSPIWASPTARRRVGPGCWLLAVIGKPVVTWRAVEPQIDEAVRQLSGTACSRGRRRRGLDRGARTAPDRHAGPLHGVRRLERGARVGLPGWCRRARSTVNA